MAHLFELELIEDPLEKVIHEGEVLVVGKLKLVDVNGVSFDKVERLKGLEEHGCEHFIKLIFGLLNLFADELYLGFEF